MDQNNGSGPNWIEWTKRIELDQIGPKLNEID